MSYYVYELWDPIKHEPFYVGKGTVGSKYPRYACHLKGAFYKKNGKYKNNSHKDHRIRKIISQGYTPEIKIVLEIEEEELAFDKEKELIKLYGRRDLKTGSLTNKTEGGDGVSGRISTEKEKLKKRLSHLGSKNYMYGKKHKFSTIRKMCKKRNQRLNNYRHTKEWKEKLKESQLIVSTKERSNPIYQIDFNGNIVKEWPNANIAAKVLNLKGNGGIYISANSHHRICKGFYWIYKSDAKILDGKLVNINEMNQKRLAPHIGNRVIQHALDGNVLKIWPSFSSAAKTLGLDYTIISNIIRKVRKSNKYGGFLWSSFGAKNNEHAE